MLIVAEALQSHHFVSKENCTRWKAFLDLEDGDRVQQVQFKFLEGTAP